MGYWRILPPTETQLKRIAEYEKIFKVKFNIKNKEQAYDLIKQYKNTGTLYLTEDENGKGGKIALTNIYYIKNETKQ